MAKIEVGDTVRLKSGGPPMMVVQRAGGLESLFCTCGWFTQANDHPDVYREARFPVIALMEAPTWKEYRDFEAENKKLRDALELLNTRGELGADLHRWISSILEYKEGAQG